MGLSAISINSGVVTILGTASVKAGPANLEDCCKAVVAFVNAVVRHRETDAAKIIPVIECNASEITARQYLDAIREQFGQKVSIPFEKTTFKTCITDGIGVYTTKGITEPIEKSQSRTSPPPLSGSPKSHSQFSPSLQILFQSTTKKQSFLGLTLVAQATNRQQC